jgi:hypothetical protein
VCAIEKRAGRWARYNSVVESVDWGGLPGADLVLKGLADLERAEESIEALLVLIGAPRLQSIGVPVPNRTYRTPPEHRLYARLSAEDPRTAHRRYNALVARLVSFERALACASA